MENRIGRILIIGAGVNGSVCAARLHECGVDVTVLARGERIDAIKKEGIVIENPFTNKRTAAKVIVTGELLPGARYGYILVVVRRNQVPDLLPMLAANCSPNVVFMGNNLAGPGEMVRALGAERVMMGFVFAGGKHDGNVIRAIGQSNFAPVASPFGEIDGTITLRAKRLVQLFNQAGLKASVSANIVDYLATHAAGVAAISAMVVKHHNNVKALARSADDMALTAAAMLETFPVLKATGHQIVPASQYVTSLLPPFILKYAFRLLFKSRLGEVGLAWHVSQAPDEIQALADDLRDLVIRSGLPVPALRKVLGMAPQ